MVKICQIEYADKNRLHNKQNPPNLIQLLGKKTKEQENQGRSRISIKYATVHTWKQKPWFSGLQVVCAYTA
jgi:hypothetical protein